MKKLFILFAFILSGCFNGDPAFFHGWENWRIKDGHHRSQRMGSLGNTSFNFRGTAQFEAFFDSNCWYDTDIYGDHLNKLGGVRKNLKNGAYFAWRPSKERNVIEIWAYGHNDSENYYSSYMGLVEVGEIADYQCNQLGDSFTFRFKGEMYEHKKNKDFEGMFGGRVFPYFGGKPVAPWNMNIHMYWYN